jgi:hypothetical protein
MRVRDMHVVPEPTAPKLAQKAEEHRTAHPVRPRFSSRPYTNAIRARSMRRCNQGSLDLSERSAVIMHGTDQVRPLSEWTEFWVDQNAETVSSSR